MVYKIGTRRSLLAKTQSRQVMEKLRDSSGQTFELLFVTTRGDQDQQTPLWQMEGNNVFTRELDQALMDDQCDLNIHSYKDLGLQRPEGVRLSAITQRSFAHDILLIKNKTIKTLFDNSLPNFRIGTSSPRRSTNIKKYMKELLSYDGQIETLPIRGNINSRIEKLINDEYDALVLAMAGLERLANDEFAKTELTSLVNNLNFLILPLSLFPCAAGQGALAIEIKNEKVSLLSPLLERVNDVVTSLEVTREKEIFRRYGGGCHLPVGIYVKQFEDGFIQCEQGIHQNKEINILNFSLKRTAPPETTHIFVGLKNNSPHPNCKFKIINNDLIKYKTIPCHERLHGNLIFTSTNVLDALDINATQLQTVWTSGVSTMKKLFQSGCWVNGTGDFLGEEELIRLKNSHFVGLFSKNSPWIYLTNDESHSLLGKTVPTYTRIKNHVSDEFISQINSCQIFYWMSYHQYERYVEEFPSISARCHCCGLGKTYKNFKERNIPVIPFVNLNEFYNWINNIPKE